MNAPAKRPSPPAPLVPVALLLAAGIAVGRCAALPVGALMALSAGLTAGGALGFRRPDLRPLRIACLAAAVTATGACLGHLAWHAVPRDHLSAMVPAGRSPLASLVGQVASSPEVVEPADRPAPWAAYERPTQTVFLLEARQVSTDQGPRPCRGLVRVRVEGVARDLRAGQTVRVLCRLGRPRQPGNPGQTDARLAARLHGTLLSAACEDPEAVEVLAGPPAGPLALPHRLRAHARQHLACEGDYEGRLLARAMVFGVRGPGLRRVQEAMAYAGIAHYLSISGMHLGLLVAMAYGLMRLARLSPRAAAGAVLVLLGGYLLVAEPAAPLLRSAIMAAAFCAAGLLGRSGASANLLALAGIALLSADPNELFRPGFQLSFGIVAGILLLTGPVRRLMFGRWLRAGGLMVFRREQRAQRWFWRTALTWTATTVSLSVAAWLAGLPLTACHFGRVSLAGALFTLVLMPVVAAMLAVALAQVLLGTLAPHLAAELGAALGLLSDAVVGFSRTVAQLPWLSVDLRPVPAWAAAVVIAGMLGALAAARQGWRRRWTALVLLAPLAGAVLATQPGARPTGQAELAVLDVGHGLCAALRGPEGQVILIDAGSQSLPDPWARALDPFLRRRRWPSPRVAFISHGNADHYNALGGLLERPAPRLVYTNDRFGMGPDIEPLLGRLLRRLDDRRVERRLLARGQTVPLGQGVTLAVLWPPALPEHESLDLNDSSLVLRLDCGRTRVLLPGDIQHEGQKLLLSLAPDDLRADVLILPHHGSATPALGAFIAAVDPRVVIRSSRRRNNNAVEDLPALRTHCQFFSTDRHGCITVRLGPDGPTVNPFIDR